MVAFQNAQLRMTVMRHRVWLGHIRVQIQFKGERSMSWNEFATEWQRLNPRHVKPDDGPVLAFLHACRETPQGYFAPLRLAWWLARRGWQRFISMQLNSR